MGDTNVVSAIATLSYDCRRSEFFTGHLIARFGVERVMAIGRVQEALDKIAARVKDYETRFANPFVAAEKGFIDEVIRPHSTRKRVARAFASLRGKKLSNPWKKHDNIPL